MKWICCQLGAREHYAIPRALFPRGERGCLLNGRLGAPLSSLLAKWLPNGKLLYCEDNRDSG
jgi:hypothetical protein